MTNHFERGIDREGWSAMRMRVLLVAVLLVLVAPCAHAGVWANFWNAVGKTVEDYNTDMLNTGNSVNEALKNKKIMDAFTNYEKNMMITCEHALENSKGVYQALKDIVLWVPRQIKKIWDFFVGILQKIRDALTAMNQPHGNTPPAETTGAPSAPVSRASGVYARASSTGGRGWMDQFNVKPTGSDETPTADTGEASPPAILQGEGLGDDFVDRFKASSFAERLKTFEAYAGSVHATEAWLQGLQTEHRKAFEPNFQRVTGELGLLEDLLFDELTQSLEGDAQVFESFVGRLGQGEASETAVIFGSLAKKVSKGTKMALMHDQGNEGLTKLVAEFDAACQKAGL
jgi:hypothetical protein